MKNKEKIAVANPATDMISQTLRDIKNIESISASKLDRIISGYYLGYIIRNKTSHVVVFGQYNDSSKAFVIRLGPAFPIYILDPYNLFELIRLSPTTIRNKDGNSYQTVTIDSLFKFCGEDYWKQCLTNLLTISYSDVE